MENSSWRDRPIFHCHDYRKKKFPKCFPHNAQNIEVYELQKFAEMTLPETNSEFAPKNRPKCPKKVSLLFLPSIFRGELAVSFREGICLGCFPNSGNSSGKIAGSLLGEARAYRKLIIPVVTIASWEIWTAQRIMCFKVKGASTQLPHPPHYRKLP